MEGIPRNILRACQYGFAEMVNNAIDHSGANTMQITLTLKDTALQFKIHDQGVGIFNKIQQDLHLASPGETILELTKGKFTSDPQKHSGEGVFFTSRLFDFFALYSGNLAFFGNARDCTFVHPFTDVAGTLVVLEILRNSLVNTAAIFNEYADPDREPSFFKTTIPLRLLQSDGVELMSRSQAKRLLARVDRFTEVELDFAGVEFIGQGFADEVFRVFAKAYPNITLLPINCEKDVRAMIAHVKSA
jgi:anti-sigma regulatory factor (Ser/Thr protein kinase)